MRSCWSSPPRLRGGKPDHPCLFLWHIPRSFQRQRPAGQRPRHPVHGLYHHDPTHRRRRRCVDRCPALRHLLPDLFRRNDGRGGRDYLAAAPVLRALYPGLAVTEQADTLSAQGDDLHLEALAGEAYFTVNDRCFYVPRFVQAAEGQVYLPLDTFAEALGCTPSTDPTTGDLRLSQTDAPATAPAYPEEDLYWLSRAIYSESGNQPMAGRIAVGTVILNRVADPAFPDTIKDVVFAPRQFSPVANGTIYHDPDERSVVAAKLCLDGVREAEPCLYFNVTTMYSWADRSRTYYCTIGGHNFYL
ncbi:MAG: cell wall hydrolase [Evtepia sp.]